MLILIIGLIILAGIAMAVGVLHNRQIQKDRKRRIEDRSRNSGSRR